jgi:hypothetical protein
LGGGPRGGGVLNVMASVASTRFVKASSVVASEWSNAVFVAIDWSNAAVFGAIDWSNAVFVVVVNAVIDWSKHSVVVAKFVAKFE